MRMKVKNGVRVSRPKSDKDWGPVTEFFFRARRLRAKQKIQCHPVFSIISKSKSIRALLTSPLVGEVDAVGG